MSFTPLTPPSAFPVWASQDIIDPVSQQNNVLVPPPEMQLSGWNRLQYAPRNWFNWLARLTYQWLEYLDQQASQANTQVVADSTNTSPILNPAAGGLVLVNIVDTAVNANFFSGICYFPPASVSAVTIQTIASSTLTVSTISTAGVMQVSGGTGPYQIWVEAKIPPA